MLLDAYFLLLRSIYEDIVRTKKIWNTIYIMEKLTEKERAYNTVKYTQ